jgi:hypothetical protein
MLQDQNDTTTQSVSGINPDQKYCAECGKIILRRAEICPGCGCRQGSAPNRQSSFFGGPQFGGSDELQSPFVGRMILMLALNFLWSGIGNLAVGDKRGWGFMLVNVVIFVVGFFTLFIPVILFFVYCSYTGYQFLTRLESAPS